MKKRISVVFVQPPIHEQSSVFGFMEPYALEVLAAAILDNKELAGWVEAEIIDLRVRPIKNLLERLKDSKIDIACLTGITIDQPKILEIATLVKKHSPGTLVVAGGHHATMLPFDYFGSPTNPSTIDLIVRGPGHHVLPQIVQSRLSGNNDFSDLRGVMGKVGPGKYCECPGWEKNIIDCPPAPRRDLVNRRYRCFGHRVSVVNTALGCPYNCIFCACTRAMASKYLMKEPPVVVEEISAAPEIRIFFADDNSFENIGRMYEVARLIEKNSIRKFFDGYCRAETIAEQPELFERWAKIGLKYLTVGFEAITDKELKDMRKKSSLETNMEANRILQKFGIVNLAHILIDPKSSRNKFHDIWQYVYKLGIIEPVFPIITPLPGTKPWDEYLADVEKVPRQFFDLAHPVTETALPIEEFYEEYSKLIARVYGRKRYVSAKTKAAISALTGKRYPIAETASTSLVSLILTPMWYKKLFDPVKIREFTEQMSLVQ